MREHSQTKMRRVDKQTKGEKKVREGEELRGYGKTGSAEMGSGPSVLFHVS